MMDAIHVNPLGASKTLAAHHGQLGGGGERIVEKRLEEEDVCI
jgi:hypothetical protein